MSTISLRVPSDLAHKYEQANEEKKKKVEQYINAWLNMFLTTQSPDAKLLEIMRQTSAIAKGNGMTPEILDELLADGE